MALNYTLSQFRHQLMIATAWIASTVATDEGMSGGRETGTKNIRRRRIPVQQLFRNLGTKYVKKAYRMNIQSFQVLFNHIEPYE